MTTAPDRAAGEGRGAEGRAGAVFVGLATLDLVLGVERIPGPDEKVVAESQLLAAGGPAANAAVACAWAGVPARLLTVLGAHALARLVSADLERHGVAVVDATPARIAPPPVAAVLVTRSTGSRAIVSRTDRDAPVVALPPPGPGGLLAEAGAVLADGHLPALAEPLLRAARAAGIPVLLDAGTWRPAFAALIPLADVVVASAAFRPPGAAGTPDGAGAAPGDVPAELLARGAHFAAVTAGSAPIRWRSASGEAGTIDVDAVEVVDTLGAGDVLHGVLAGLLAEGPRSGTGALEDGRLVEAIRAAARVASASCAFPGTRAWIAEGSIPRPTAP